MAGFGSDLRLERERQSMSLDALCAHTKIQQRHLQALEQDDFAALPGGVFRRGIVRAYLAALQLDQDFWMQRFQQTFEEQARARGQTPEPEADAWETFAENVRRNRAGASRRTSLRWLGVVLLLLVVAGAAYAVWRYVLNNVLRFW